MDTAQSIHGQLGILAYDPLEDKVQCHICGKWFRGLNAHIWQTHGWTPDEYREEFGLKRGQSLICQGTREKLREINLAIGNWRHLSSQTMSKEELNQFLRSVSPGRGYHLRRQSLILYSKRLKEKNPMDNPQSLEKRKATLRETWYGTKRMTDISKRNMLNTIAKLRQKNMAERRWTCPCGKTFPCRKEAEHHRRWCPTARQQRIGNQVRARKLWWDNLAPELKEQFGRRMSEAKKGVAIRLEGLLGYRHIPRRKQRSEAE